VPHAVSYLDPGTPEEQSRRRFMANVTIGIGAIITVVVGIPSAISLIPESLLKPSQLGGTWTPLAPEEFKALAASVDSPVKLTFSFKYQDGYLPPVDDTQFAWGVKLSPAEISSFQEKRPDLFDKPSDKVAYDAVSSMGFVVFSSICPHLGCRYNWDASAKRFICPCHGSQFDVVGAHVAGPAPRGLDPLPFREHNGAAEVTWIQYRSQEPDRVIVAYS
jgi:Rieske Fe-S protein